ncbi:hypothetical protein [Erythrobacter sp. SD-21]|uniref:hypothetical protein n=1 Tax=Erythrobacter sp. SD-21 TaxID=161528 RepID=UPI000153FD3F|nr:hypothetical protein [Erythrobacter sp. SD-21]EDL48677.1 hypothetical protein ED21_30769 [Erythrobacter sp. SD-21]
MSRTSRVRQIGWLLLLGACVALFLALTFQVNAVKSDVRLIERQIIAAERSKLMLETEFQTRASQQQLAAWNQVEFGYNAPRADQYVEHERQLAALGTPRGLGAPQPIRVAKADTGPVEDDSLFGDWMSDDEPSEGGQALAVAVVESQPAERLATSLAQRLARPASASVAMAEAAR